MPSKLGPCLLAADASTFDFLEAGASIIKLVDDFSQAAEIVERYPDVLLIGGITARDEEGTLWRAEHYFERGMAPEVAARLFHDLHLATYLANSAIKYWEGPHEPRWKTASQMEWYSKFEIARMYLLREEGFRAVVGNFGTGQPDLPLWPHFVEAIEACVWTDSILGLHEYTSPWMWWGSGMYQPDDTDEGESGWATLRYRKLLDDVLLPGDMQKLKIAITECGLGDAPFISMDDNPGDWRANASWWDRWDGRSDPIDYWRKPQRNAHRYYAEQLKWYDMQLRLDPNIVGAVVFGIGIQDESPVKEYDIGGTAVVDYLTAYLRVESFVQDTHVRGEFRPENLDKFVPISRPEELPDFLKTGETQPLTDDALEASMEVLSENARTQPVDLDPEIDDDDSSDDDFYDFLGVDNVPEYIKDDELFMVTPQPDFVLGDQDIANTQARHKNKLDAAEPSNPDATQPYVPITPAGEATPPAEPASPEPADPIAEEPVRSPFMDDDAPPPSKTITTTEAIADYEVPDFLSDSRQATEFLDDDGTEMVDIDMSADSADSLFETDLLSHGAEVVTTLDVEAEADTPVAKAEFVEDDASANDTAELLTPVRGTDAVESAVPDAADAEATPESEPVDDPPAIPSAQPDIPADYVALGQNLLVNYDFSAGSYDITDDAISVPNDWNLWFASESLGKLAGQDHPWGVPETRAYRNGEPSPFEQTGIFRESSHVLHLGGAWHPIWLRLSQKVRNLKVGQPYRFDVNVLPRLVKSFDATGQVMAQDDLAGEHRLLVEAGEDVFDSGWITSKDVHVGTYTTLALDFIATKSAAQITIELRGRRGLVNTGWFLEEPGLHQLGLAQPEPDIPAELDTATVTEAPAAAPLKVNTAELTANLRNGAFTQATYLPKTLLPELRVPTAWEFWFASATTPSISRQTEEWQPPRANVITSDMAREDDAIAFDKGYSHTFRVYGSWRGLWWKMWQKLKLETGTKYTLEVDLLADPIVDLLEGGIRRYPHQVDAGEVWLSAHYGRRKDERLYLLGQDFAPGDPATLALDFTPKRDRVFVALEVRSRYAFTHNAWHVAGIRLFPKAS